MIVKYEKNIEAENIVVNLQRLINQRYKLLPLREEHQDWQKHLAIITEEVAGLAEVMLVGQASLFQLLCKLEGLVLLEDESQFPLYRKVVFESLTILTGVISKCQE